MKEYTGIITGMQNGVVIPDAFEKVPYNAVNVHITNPVGQPDLKLYITPGTQIGNCGDEIKVDVMTTPLGLISEVTGLKFPGMNKVAVESYDLADIGI